METLTKCGRTAPEMMVQDPLRTCGAVRDDLAMMLQVGALTARA